MRKTRHISIRSACGLQPACLVGMRTNLMRAKAHTSIGKRASRTARGFTLIEVLMTMLVLAVVLPILMEGISLSLHAASSSRHKTEAANLAQDELNQLTSTGMWNSQQTGDFGTDHPGYTWTCQTADQDYGVTEVRLTVAWAEQGQPRQLTVATMTQTNPTLPGSDTSGTTGIQGGLP